LTFGMVLFIILGDSFSLPWKLCRKSIHGSTSSPRTDHGTLETNYLAVRPEALEG
jgi:hypothetical protein